MYEEFFEKLNSLDEDYLVEMATINPDYCKHHSIHCEVEQRNEGPVPHVHVYHSNDRNPKKCSYISLNAAEYSPHHKNKGIYLTPEIKDEFIELMNMPCGYYRKNNKNEFVELTGYQYAVFVWSETYCDKKLDKFQLDDTGMPVMPDYSILPTRKGKKEIKIK